MTPLVPDGPQ